MHPQLGYQFALDRGRELQAAAEADRLARSARHPGNRWWRPTSSARPLPRSTPAVAFPHTLSQVLDEVAVVVEDLGPRAIAREATPVVHSLVEEVLALAKEAGLTDLPSGHKPDEPAVVGYRTLANVGSRTRTAPQIDLARPDARRIGFVIADLRALERDEGSAPTGPDPSPSLRRRLLNGRLARFLGTRETARRGQPVGDDCLPGLPVCT